MTPLVSVIVCFHRVTPYLRPAVASLLQQTERNLEVLLVDNGTGAGLSALGEDAADPRLRLLSQGENLGIAGGHNCALAQARGEFIALLDSDDIALPTRLERQVAALRANADVGLVACAADRIDPSGRIVGRTFTLGAARDHLCFTAYSNAATTPTVMGRRAVFNRFPYRGELEKAADYDFFARATEFAGACALPETLGQYRIHPGQTTSEAFDRQMLTACVIRVLTGRRRAGRDEDYGSMIREFSPWLAQPPARPTALRRFARYCLADNQPRLAAYHARKLVAFRASPRDVVVAMWIAGRALRMAHGERALVARLFLSGPLRAHGLRPLA